VEFDVEVGIEGIIVCLKFREAVEVALQTQVVHERSGEVDLVVVRESKLVLEVLEEGYLVGVFVVAPVLEEDVGDSE